MRKKGLMVLGLTVAMSLSLPLLSYAGEWKQNAIGWWWETSFGTYPTNSWCWIDGNHDKIQERYYFDENGYLLVNTTTPDNYTVNENGACVIDGEVCQSKTDTIYFRSEKWIDNGPETEVGFDEFCDEYYANYSKNYGISVEECERRVPREKLRERLDYYKDQDGLMEEDARWLLIDESKQPRTSYPSESYGNIKYN